MVDPFELLTAGDLAGLRQKLQADPAAVTSRHTSGASLLSYAAYLGSAEAVDLVREWVTEPDPHEAAVLGDIERLRAALAAGWDSTQLSPDGFTALALAAFFSQSAAFSLLLPLATDLDRRADNRQQVAALHAATAAHRADMVEQLLVAGATPDLAQANGITALHAAARHGDLAIVGLLLLFGAAPDQADASGMTAVDHSRSGGQDWLAGRLQALAGGGPAPNPDTAA